jgi:hypothetical protein
MVHEPVSYRLYTFVAGLYLSPLQCGLQSVHVCSELYAHHICYIGEPSSKMDVFDAWAQGAGNKTVVICNARTSQGVKDTYKHLRAAGDRFNLPAVIFYEDEESLGRAATATGIIVPDYFYAAVLDEGRPPFGESYVHTFWDNVDGVDRAKRYDTGTPEFEFIRFLQSFRLV